MQSTWWQWFYMPGDAVIAYIGPTTLGRFLELTPGSSGSISSAVISAAAWLLGIYAAFYLGRFFLDAADPTYLQQRRERRQAQAEARRAHKERMRRRSSRPSTR